ncbi:TMEM216 [Bugula neritina]|uniref:TMEM216 n=1 Tax=Bugula neritina TaxID=10212 RepID=A0A7J7JER6_BUGNE|nr:TMEM216 [Bugula neritina]
MVLRSYGLASQTEVQRLWWLSLLPYQIVLYLNGFYTLFYTICELLMFIYKGETLPYAPSSLGVEIVILLLTSFVEILRLFFGKKGNLTERPLLVGVSLGLSLPAVLGNVFLLIWQTYLLRAELILIIVQLSFIGVEMLLGFIAIILFSRATPY